MLGWAWSKVIITLMVVASLVSVLLGRPGEETQYSDLREKVQTSLKAEGGDLISLKVEELDPTSVLIVISEETNESALEKIPNLCREHIEGPIQVQVQRAWAR